VLIFPIFLRHLCGFGGTVISPVVIGNTRHYLCRIQNATWVVRCSDCKVNGRGCTDTKIAARACHNVVID
jgi:hypothetical protein